MYNDCDCPTCRMMSGKPVYSPKEAESHNNRGVSYAQTGQLGKAISLFNAAIRYDFNYAEPHYNLARAYLQMGKRPEAIISELQTALKINPGYADARSLLCGIYVDVGQLDEAIREAQAMVRINYNNGEAHLILATAYFKQGRRFDAIREAELALKSGGWEEEARQLLTALRR